MVNLFFFLDWELIVQKVGLFVQKEVIICSGLFVHGVKCLDTVNDYVEMEKKSIICKDN